MTRRRLTRAVGRSAPGGGSAAPSASVAPYPSLDGGDDERRGD